MGAAVINFTINANADFSQSLIWTDSNGNPIDLTGYTAKMQIANHAGPGETVYATLDTGSGGITITPLMGKIDLFIAATETSTFTFANAVYDLLMYAPGGEIIRLVMGPITLSLGVTVD